MAKKISKTVEEKIAEAMESKRIYYIVDTENVDKDSYNDLTGLRKNDVLELMYTSHSKNISYNTLEIIHNCSADIRFKSFSVVQATKNLLDFKMVVEGTSILAKSNKYFVVFVSEDKGFDSAVEHINELYGERCVRVDKITKIRKCNTGKDRDIDPLKI